MKWPPNRTTESFGQIEFRSRKVGSLTVEPSGRSRDVSGSAISNLKKYFNESEFPFLSRKVVEFPNHAVSPGRKRKNVTYSFF
jgi:hypothetical protein